MSVKKRKVEPAKETVNFCRFSLGIVDTSPVVLRDILESYIPHTELQNVINNMPLWQKQRFEDRLTQPMKDLISNASTDGYKDFDITLLYTLLRNVCSNLRTPTQGWGNEPQPTDTTLSDDIERIRLLRNGVFAHMPRAKLTENEYTEHWGALMDVCHRCTIDSRLTSFGHDYEQQLKDFENQIWTEKEVTDTLDKVSEIEATSIKELQEILVKVNEDAAHCVPLHPLYRNTGLSAKQLYSDVRIQRNDPSKPGSSGEIIDDHADLFTKDEEPVGNVYMLGQPGRGKTTFCLHLLTLWCAAMTFIPSTALSVWKFGQNCFHFVFYVSLRHVHRCRSRIEDMICDLFVRYDGMREVILRVLSNPKYRCLIMVDGLDEWVISPEVVKELTNLNLKGLPDTGRLSMNCTILFASRHWKLDLIKPIYKAKDIEVEILGLTEKGKESIIENILKNQTELGIGSEDYNAKLTKLKTQVEKSKSSIDVPMFVTMTAFLGLHGDYVQESDTGLFFDQVVLLIRRAIDDGRISKDAADGLHITHGSSIAIPKVITETQQNKILSRFIFVLYKLGKVAYNGLIELNLVFDQDTLREEDVLGKRALDIALKVGIVSQMTAPRFFLVPKVSIEFIHKSMQEAMAALYIVCGKSDALTTLCKYCSTVDKVMEMSNVLKYMAGISPATGCEFSKHITHVATNDQGILNDREQMEMDLMFDGRLRMLFNMQFECYKELCHTSSLTKDSDPSPQYHVTDVVLQDEDDDDKVKTTCDIIRGCPDSILSFSMLVIGNQLWSACSVVQLLPQCSNLTTLQVLYKQTSPEPGWVSVIPTLAHLQRVWYGHPHRLDGEFGDVDSRVVRAILQFPRLRYVKLYCVVLDDDALVLTDHMTEFQKVELYNVRMSPEAWNRFVTSLRTVKHGVDVTIERSEIDDDTRDMISKSEHLKVTKKWWNFLIRWSISFTSAHEVK